MEVKAPPGVNRGGAFCFNNLTLLLLLEAYFWYSITEVLFLKSQIPASKPTNLYFCLLRISGSLRRAYHLARLFCIGLAFAFVSG